MVKYKSIFVFLILLFSFTQAFGATAEKEFKKIIDFREGGEIYLKNVNGNVDVESWQCQKEKILII